MGQMYIEKNKTIYQEKTWKHRKIRFKSVFLNYVNFGLIQ